LPKKWDIQEIAKKWDILEIAKNNGISISDNSRDNSPLNDVVLQSAPGSPGSHNYGNNDGNQATFNSQYQ
jgi:hypothetical protein